VDMLRWLMGEVEEAFAYSNHLAYPDFPDDDFSTVLYKYNCSSSALRPCSTTSARY
jgi:hypothetical protein